MAAKAPPNDLVNKTWRLIRDCYTIVADFCWWLWTRLWRLNRGLVRTFMPGQKRHVHNIVTVCLVLLEIIGIYVWVVAFVSRH